MKKCVARGPCSRTRAPCHSGSLVRKIFRKGQLLVNARVHYARPLPHKSFVRPPEGHSARGCTRLSYVRIALARVAAASRGIGSARTTTPASKT